LALLYWIARTIDYFFLVFIGLHQAIGLLVAAKPIICLKEGGEMCEYGLIGT
jgi:hypothetical protein